MASRKKHKRKVKRKASGSCSRYAKSAENKIYELERKVIKLQTDLRKKKNPLRHFPKLKGRGRPAKKRKWDMVTRLTSGAIAEKTFTATQSEAYAMARRIARRKFHGKRVAEVILDDRR